ncbi:MAG TPA: hypothetical protein VK625_22905, partial [Flavitalea sp.]|nr:hypothetical protein [Flavitalea sp.]
FSGSVKISSGNTVLLDNALNDMLTMFSKNKLKRSLFIAKHFVNVAFIPFIRKAIGLKTLLSITKSR